MITDKEQDVLIKDDYLGRIRSWLQLEHPDDTVMVSQELWGYFFWDEDVSDSHETTFTVYVASKGYLAWRVSFANLMDWWQRRGILKRRF